MRPSLGHIGTILSEFCASILFANAKTPGEPRIVGASSYPAQGRYPYFAEIEINPPDQDPFICGGTLVHSDLVLTAAQCFVQGATATVRIGSTSKTDDTQRLETITMTPHKEYANGFENDIMLIKLKKPIKIIQPVKYNTNIEIPGEGQVLTMFGYGALSEFDLTPSDRLLQTTALTGSFLRCSRQFDFAIDQNMHVCSVPNEGGGDTCDGDGGGPLIIMGSDATSDLQVGIVSFGAGCGRPGSYSGYTNVAGYSDWISGNICALSSNRPSNCPLACFSSNSVVNTIDRGPLKLSQVRIGDQVMVGPNKYQPIYSFGHYLPSTHAQFLEISTDFTRIQVTGDHMIFVTDKRAIPASTLRPGDEIMYSTGERGVIVKIDTTVAVGVYAPFTPSGKIIVDGLLMSSFAALEGSESLSVFGVSFSYQWIALSFESLHRLICHRLGSCPGETYTDKGMSHWVSIPQDMVMWILKQQCIIRSSLVSMILVILALFYLVDRLPLLLLCAYLLFKVTRLLYPKK